MNMKTNKQKNSFRDYCNKIDKATKQYKPFIICSQDLYDTLNKLKINKK